ncbi:hypothetical protein PTTG_30629, partial [Puccinia triticina 1-1 BBBD Race 1]
GDALIYCSELAALTASTCLDATLATDVETIHLDHLDYDDVHVPNSAIRSTNTSTVLPTKPSHDAPLFYPNGQILVAMQMPCTSLTTSIAMAARPTLPPDQLALLPQLLGLHFIHLLHLPHLRPPPDAHR